MAKASRAMKVTSRLLPVVLAMAMAVAVAMVPGGWSGEGALNGPGAGSAQEPRLLPVAARALIPQSGYWVNRFYTGLVTARRSSELGFELPGRLLELRVQEGDRVPSGQLLARIDDRRHQARLRELEAALQEARAQEQLSKQTLERLRRLHRQSHVSRQLLDEAAAKARVAAARSRSLEAQHAAAAVELEATELHAPFAATVIRRLHHEGSVVDAGQPVLVLQETGPLEARIGLPVDVASELTVHETVRLDWRERQVDGTLQALLPDVDRTSRTLTAVVALDERVDAAAGELIRLRLQQWIDSPGYWVPTAALTEGLRGLWSVYLLRSLDDGRRHRVERGAVEVLHSLGEQVFVRGTLSGGERIVVSGVHRLVPGQLVAIAGRSDTLAEWAP